MKSFYKYTLAFTAFMALITAHGQCSVTNHWHNTGTFGILKTVCANYAKPMPTKKRPKPTPVLRCANCAINATLLKEIKQ